jgi:hypothetical protein
MNTNQRYACPCCGYLTLAGKPPGTYEVCPVCLWEDDDVQSRDPSFSGGANKMSLTQARSNFVSFGAVAREHQPDVRKPRPEEIPPTN